MVLENTNQKENTSFIYRIICCLIIIPFVFYWTGRHKLFSSPLSISIAAVLLSIVFVRKFLKGIKVKDILVLLFNAALLIINWFIYQSYGVVVTFYNLFILLIILNNTEFSAKQVNRIRLLVVVLLGIFLFSLKIRYVYSADITDFKGNEINANTFGILALACYFNFYALVSGFSIKRRYKALCFIAATAVAIYYINLSACRSALIAILLFVALQVVFKKWEMKNYKKIFKIAVIIAIAFPFIYLLAIEQLGDAVLFGKSIGSRELVWRGTIDLIKRFPLLGSGTVHNVIVKTERGYTSSAHNVFLGFWKTLGIVPMITFAIYLIKGKNINKVTKKNFTAKKMFLSCIAICALETLLNDSDIYIFFLTLLLTVAENEEASAGEGEIQNDTEDNSLLLVREKPFK